MLSSKPKTSMFPTAIAIALGLSVVVAFASLVEAVSGMTSFL